MNARLFFSVGLASALSLALLGACGDNATTAPSWSPADAIHEGDAAPSPELPAPVPGVHLRRLEPGEQGLGGPNCVATAGDFVLENAHARFVIQGEGRPRTWIPYSGALIGADLARAHDAPGHDNIGELAPLPALLKAFRPNSFEVKDDGAGGTAHLRVLGTDIGIPVIDQVFPFPPHGYPVVIDYILHEDETALLMTTSVTNHRNHAHVIEVGDAVIWGSRLELLTPGTGWGQGALQSGGEYPAVLAEGAHVAYGLVPLEGVLRIPVAEADMLPLTGLAGIVPPGEAAVYRRLLIVGATLEDVRRRMLATTPTEEILVEVQLDDPTDSAALARVVILDEHEKPVAAAPLTDEPLSFRLPAGRYHAVAEERGRPRSALSDEVTLEGDGAQTTVTLPATGRIAFDISGDDHHHKHRDGIPVRIVVQAGHDAPLASPIVELHWSATGQGSFLIAPGEYTVTATRGFEYEIVRANLTVTASEEEGEAFVGVLKRSVDTSGWISADLHVHTEYSIDSRVPIEERIVQLAAVGIERAVLTDHDFIADKDHLIAPLGLAEFVRFTAGCEVSPLGRHVNGFPMVDNPARPAYFGVPWHYGYDDEGRFLGVMEFPETFEIMRAEFQTGIIQINHPRGSQGYLDKIRYDPEVGLEALPEGVFSTDFDAIELINAGAIQRTRDYVLADWYSFLRQGLRVTGTAVSDTHTEHNPGYPRTYLFVGEDDPRAVDDDMLVEAILGLRAVAASGPFIEAFVGTAGIGDTVTGEGPHDLLVRGQAPSWMPVDWVQIVIDGEVVEEVAVAPPAEPNGYRFEQIFPLPEREEDYFVVVLAGALDKTMDPVAPGQPVLSITNPIFIEADR